MATSFPTVYLNKLKELFATKSHTHTKSQITDLSGSIGWPDYLNGRTLSKGSDGFFTVPQNGWVWCWTDGDGRFYVRRNGSESICVAINGDATQASTTLIPVLAGDKVTASVIHDNTMHFFPCL